MKLNLIKIQTSLAELLLVTDSGDVVHGLSFADERSRIERELFDRHGEVMFLERVENSFAKTFAEKLDRFFAGDITALKDVAVAPGGSELQRWLAAISTSIS